MLIAFLDEDDEPPICYEITTTYVYDLIDENEHAAQTNWSETRMACSSSLSSSSSCFDDQTTDNDDGYSTHSLDDVEQQRLVTSSPQPLVPFFSSPSRQACLCYSEQYVSPLRRLIEQLTWRNPFKKTMHDMMMMNHLFDWLTEVVIVISGRKTCFCVFVMYVFEYILHAHVTFVNIIFGWV